MLISKKCFPLVIIFSLIVLSIVLLQYATVYLWDETVYLSTAENLFNKNPYYTEIDYRPPLLPFLISIFSYFLPIELTAHILTALFFLLGIISIYLLGKELYNEKVGFFSSIIFGLSPFLIHSSTKIMTDLPSTSLLIASFFFLSRYFKKRKERYLIFSSVMLGLSILMRFTSMVFIVLIVLFFLIQKENKKTIMKYFIYTLMPIIPYLIWAQINLGFALFPFIKAQIVIAGSGLIPDKLYYIKAVYSVCGLIAVTGLILYLISLRYIKKTLLKKDLIMILWVLLFIIYLTLNPHKELRYILPVIPAIYILSAIGFTQFKNKWINILLCLLLIFCLIFPLHRIAYFDGRMDMGEEILLDRTKAVLTNLELIKENCHNIIYSNSYYPIIAYYTKIKTVSTWPWDSSFYQVFPKNMNSMGCYIHFNEVEKHPTKEWLNSNIKFKIIKDTNQLTLYYYTP